MNLKQAEQKALALSNKDGLLDILLGLMFIVFATIDPLENTGVSSLGSYLPIAIYLLLGIPTYNYIKRRLIAPRTGMASVGVRHNRQYRNIFLVTIGLQIFTLIILLLGMSGNLQWLPDALPVWFMDAIFGIGALMVFSLIAYSMQAPRFYLYGFLLGLSLPLGVILRAESRAVNSLPQAVAGILITISGIYTLAQFLRTYAPQTGEV